MSNEKLSETYQSIGEFVIVFQWVEDLYRQIGWFILDPNREDWPPTALRTETNHDLINKVTDLFVELTKKYAFPNGDDQASSIVELRDRFHELRRQRNRILHSTFLEIKGGGEVHGYIRSNPKVGVDSDTGELIFDQEHFSPVSIHNIIQEYGDDMFRLGQHHIQLIHWAPFERFVRET